MKSTRYEVTRVFPLSPIPWTQFYNEIIEKAFLCCALMVARLIAVSLHDRSCLNLSTVSFYHRQVLPRQPALLFGTIRRFREQGCFPRKKLSENAFTIFHWLILFLHRDTHVCPIKHCDWEYDKLVFGNANILEKRDQTVRLFRNLIQWTWNSSSCFTTIR